MENNKPDKKPNVIPNIPQEDLIKQANQTGDAIAKQFVEEQKEEGIDVKPLMSESEFAAAMEMAKRRDEEQARIKSGSKIIRPELVDNDGNHPDIEVSYGNEQLEEENNKSYDNISKSESNDISKPQTISFSKPDLNEYVEPVKTNPTIEDPFDMIPLPSEGLIYPHKKTHIKVAYMNASDEDILTNPNLLESGKMLDVLFERKIKEPGINYKDLHVGDRNAIMLWLRATAYGNDYPVELFDPKTEEPFKMTVDLSKLKTKNLKVKPGNDGLFSLKLSTGDIIKYKLLTIYDEELIENHTEQLAKSKAKVYDINTFALKRHVVAVNDNTDRDYVERFVEIMRIVDSRTLKKTINEIESGIDMRINVRTPGGESITTFLPLNLSFFWPDFGT